MCREVSGSDAMGFLATKPTMIITTLHGNGVLNAGVFGAYTNLSPTLVGAAVSTAGHTYENILRGGEFVINVPGAELVDALRILAAPVPRHQSEVKKAGLTPRDGLHVDTPSIAECAAAVEMAFVREVPVAHHSFLIGEVLGGWIKEEVMDSDGRIDIFKARVMKDFKYPKPYYVLPGEVVEG